MIEKLIHKYSIHCDMLPKWPSLAKTNHLRLDLRNLAPVRRTRSEWQTTDEDWHDIPMVELEHFEPERSQPSFGRYRHETCGIGFEDGLPRLNWEQI